MPDNPPNANGKKVVYGNTLSTVEFNNSDLRGTWSWQNPQIKVMQDTSIKAIAVFTPVEDRNYLATTKEIELTVEKKKLNINIEENGKEYTYDGTEHTVLYKIEYALTTFIYFVPCNKNASCPL